MAFGPKVKSLVWSSPSQPELSSLLGGQEDGRLHLRQRGAEPGVSGGGRLVTDLCHIERFVHLGAEMSGTLASFPAPPPPHEPLLGPNQAC